MNTAALQGCGIGLRREHYAEVLAERPDVAWFEVISENFMVDGGRPRHVLDQVRANYPLALHGVSLSLGADEPLDPAHLRKLRELVEWVEPAIVSDHLCWTGLGGHNSHDLLPLPFTAHSVRVAAQKIRQVQDVLRRRILVENISTYLRFEESEMTEWEFLSAVAIEGDCHILLDVNNVYVNSRNHGFDPVRYLEGVPASRVAQFHLAGHEDHGHVVIDTHDHPVCDAVWDLYREALARFGSVPTLIEWDASVPELPRLLAEAASAQSLMEAAHAAP